MYEKVMARPLWLDPIPDMITVSQIIEKYAQNYESCRQKHVLNKIEMVKRTMYGRCGCKLLAAKLMLKV